MLKAMLVASDVLPMPGTPRQDDQIRGLQPAHAAVEIAHLPVDTPRQVPRRADRRRPGHVDGPG